MDEQIRREAMRTVVKVSGFRCRVGAVNRILRAACGLGTTIFFMLSPGIIAAQQLPEVNILTAVSNMAFSSLWVAEQLKDYPSGRRRALPERSGWSLGKFLCLQFGRTSAGASRRRAFDRDPGP